MGKAKPRKAPAQAPEVDRLEDALALIGIRSLERAIGNSIPKLVTPTPKGQPLIVHRGGGRFDLVTSRLAEIEAELRRGDPIGDELRVELQALVALVARHAEARKDKRASRRTSQSLFERAAVVIALRERHGYTLKEAIYAAAPEATEKERANIERHQRTIAQAGGTVQVRQSALDAALARLKSEGERK